VVRTQVRRTDGRTWGTDLVRGTDRAPTLMTFVTRSR